MQYRVIAIDSLVTDNRFWLVRSPLQDGGRWSRNETLALRLTDKALLDHYLIMVQQTLLPGRYTTVVITREVES